LLAYAAQGLTGDASSQSGGEIREFLTRATAALAGLGDLFNSLIASESSSRAEKYRANVAVLRFAMRATASAAIDLVLAQTAISSQLVDNLNASIHLQGAADGLVPDRRDPHKADLRSASPIRNSRGRACSLRYSTRRRPAARNEFSLSSVLSPTVALIMTALPISASLNSNPFGSLISARWSSPVTGFLIGLGPELAEARQR
jgi:hypothetical protein